MGRSVEGLVLGWIHLFFGVCSGEGGGRWKAGFHTSGLRWSFLDEAYVGADSVVIPHCWPPELKCC